MQNRDFVPNSPPAKCDYYSLASGDLPRRTESFGITKAFDHQTLGIRDLEKPSIKWHVPLCPVFADKTQFIDDYGGPYTISVAHTRSQIVVGGANINSRFTGNFLRLVQATINGGELDGPTLIRLMCGRVASSLAQCLLERVDGWLYLAFDDFVKHHYSRYALKHVARIDVPTFVDPSVSQRLDAVSLRYGFCTVGRTLDSLLRSGCSIIVLFTQHMPPQPGTETTSRWKVSQVVSDREHRQEIVVNGLGPYLSRRSFTVMLLEFLELCCCLGNHAGEFWSHFLIYQRKTNHAIHLVK
ncbi:hypothetical protein EDB85DRAFT_2171739 [Lactarius pseudohatsudake]|nr:hypothetical protein EDB85DRAFT_2171739 [Lactarius pseudohatsudake]